MNRNDTAREAPMRLRSYIAPAAPATRAPCDGTEPDLRVEFGFTPQWFRRALDIDFGRRWHTDALYRHQTTRAMRLELNRRFPGLGLGGPDPENAPASIDGVHGALMVPLLFGIPARYGADMWPAAEPAFLDPARVDRLEPPDLDGSPVFRKLLEQVDTLHAAFGRVGGYVNWQGVLNTAFRVRGPEIFTDLLDCPARARHLFEVVARTMEDGMRRLYAAQAATGFVVRHATVSNCVVNMVSPAQYREFLLPWDTWLSERFEGFGVHNCAWNADPYIEDYARIPRLGYVDMGLESDLVKARACCPLARRAIMYPPGDLIHKPLEAIRADLERVRREYAPCDIVMADIDPETPDERVTAFAAIAETVSAPRA